MNKTQRIQDALDELETNIEREITAGFANAVELRQLIHRNARVSGEERETTELLVDRLGLEQGEWVTDGFLSRIGGDGPAVALRAELDALPIQEETGVPWASVTGASHLCGHDVHMAALTLAVRAIRNAGTPVPLVVALQPREETLPCGAEDFIKSQWLQGQDIRAFFGAHVQPQLPKGTAAATAGAVNASADEFNIVVTGRPSHGAYPHLGRDPIVAVSAIVTALQQIVSRRSNPMDPAVVTVGEIRGGSSFNAIPELAKIRGTIRTYTEEARAEMQEMIRVCATGVAQGYGCEATTTIGLGEPVLHNDEQLAEEVTASLVSAGFVSGEALRSCGADDFAFYCTRFPSLMVFVGVGDTSSEMPGLHHPRFLPADSTILDVARVLLTSYVTAGRLILEEAERK